MSRLVILAPLLVLGAPLLALGAACATTTTITADAPGAEVTASPKGKLGRTPVKYESKMWVWETESVTVSAPGHKPRNVELKRSELDTMPMVGSVCLCFTPIVWPLGGVLCASGGWKLPATTLVKLEREGPLPSSSTSASGPPAAVSPRLLVLEVQGSALDENTKRAIASAMTQEIGAAARFTVLSQADVNQLAALEGSKQEMGCSTSTCLAEIAGALGARYVIFGDAAKLGALIVVNLNLFDTQTATAVQRASFEAKTLEEIPERSRDAARTLTNL